MQIKNNKWFTLVELIIVITILAILATLAFLAFQSYSWDARDSKRKSDISQIKTSISLKATSWIKYTDLVLEDNNSASWTWNLAIQWYADYATSWLDEVSYKVWKTNFQTLWIDEKAFKDTLVDKDYVLWAVNTGSTNAYQLAATLENWWSKIAYVSWDYSPRQSIAVSWSVISDNQTTLESNVFLFKVWDYITNGNSTSEVWNILSVSPDTKTLTVTWALSTANSDFNIVNHESEWLIFNWTVVKDGLPPLPY